MKQQLPTNPEERQKLARLVVSLSKLTKYERKLVLTKEKAKRQAKRSQ